MSKIFKARPYQQACINTMLRLPACGLFLKPGMGKTASTLTAIDLLLHDYFKIRRVLIIAPKRVAQTVWTDEIAEWQHLQGLKAVRVLGPEKQRLAALDQNAELYIINRENIPWLVATLHQRAATGFFDACVVDESSSFKNPTSKRFRALKTILPFFKWRAILTGTPAPKGYLDLWSQVYILDQGKTLGRTMTAYRDTYFLPDKRNGQVIFSYKLKLGAGAKISAILRPFCAFVDSDVCLDLKKPLYVDVRARMTPSEQRGYDQFAKDLVLSLPEGEEIAAPTAAAINIKLLQYANGAIYDEAGKAHEIHKQKLEALDELIESAQGNPVLVFYNYRHDLERIKARYKHARELKTEQDIRDWQAGKAEIMLAHPASCGHGLNLQSGGHLVVWFGLTYDLELYEQANARLARPGQKEQVVIHRIIAKDTIDEIVASALSAKAVSQNMILDQLKREYKNF